MKKIIFILTTFFLVISCSKPSDCIESTGAIITKEFEVTSFNRIDVNKGIKLVITQGNEFKVIVETGENLMGDITVEVVDGSLILKDNTTCNWVREYGHTTVFVTTPALDYLDINSRTERDIVSNGVLTYPILRLIAIDLSEGAGTNDFHIQVNNYQTVIENNNVSRYFISGQSDEMYLNFYDGHGRFEGENFIVKNINVFHRGSNDMIVHPTESITGKMYSTGDIVLKNVPLIVDVEQLYQGSVIYP